MKACGGRYKRDRGSKTELPQAESYIRDRLSDEGLEVRNIEDIFGQVTLANVTADTT
jgi:hypothetical protein